MNIPAKSIYQLLTNVFLFSFLFLSLLIPHFLPNPVFITDSNTFKAKIIRTSELKLPLLQLNVLEVCMVDDSTRSLNRQNIYIMDQLSICYSLIENNKKKSQSLYEYFTMLERLYNLLNLSLPIL